MNAHLGKHKNKFFFRQFFAALHLNVENNKPQIVLVQMSEAGVRCPFRSPHEE